MDGDSGVDGRNGEAAGPEVSSLTGILANMATLERYRQSHGERAYWGDRIGKGHCFVAVKVGSQWFFGPSRFVGYARNSRGEHESDPGDGRDTDKAISRVLGMCGQMPDVDSAYEAFCVKEGIEPKDRQRKYWLVELPVIRGRWF